MNRTLTPEAIESIAWMRRVATETRAKIDDWLAVHRLPGEHPASARRRWLALHRPEKVRRMASVANALTRPDPSDALDRSAAHLVNRDPE